MGRNGDGIWIKPYRREGYSQVGWRDATGKQHRKVVLTELVHQFKSMGMVRLGKVSAQEMTLGQVVPEYIKFNQHLKSHKDIKQRSEYILKEFGDVPLSEIKVLQVEKYMSKLMAEGKSPATLNHYLLTIKHMFRKAVDWGFTPEESLKHLRRVKQYKLNNKRLRYLTKEEADRLLEACKKVKVSFYLYPIVAIALNTGMRRGEILGLQWNQIDVRHGMILLSDTKNGERREVPLNKTVLNVLNAMPRPIDNGKVFPVNNPHNWKAWMRALQLAGIVDFHFHDLRHTFASWMIMKGADLPTLQSILGHKSITMTMRYAHLAPDHRAAAVRLLDENNVQNVTHQFTPNVVNL